MRSLAFCIGTAVFALPSLAAAAVAEPAAPLAAAAVAEPAAPLAAAATPAQEATPTVAPSNAYGADAKPASPRDAEWDAYGEARATANRLAAFGTDNLGTPSGQGTFLQSRVIAGGQLHMSRALIAKVEIEVLNGYAAGDVTALGTAYTDRPFPLARDNHGDIARVIPRQAHVAFTAPFGQFAAGVQTFRWGTGMLVNDGRGDAPFGDAWLGNAVARASFATKPLAHSGVAPFWQQLAVFLAGDLVVRDDNANLLDGDSARAVVAGARAEHGDAGLGVLVFYRNQTDREDPRRPTPDPSYAKIFGADVWGKAALAEGPRHRVTAEGEFALLRGHTTRPWSDATWQSGADVASWGAVGRLRWDDQATALTGALEIGYASGDANPRDGTARTFTMHSDHNVGLVLFDHVLPMLSARSVDRVADPNLAAVAPPGARFAVNPGAVQNAAYVFPTVRWRPLEPMQLRLGYLLAMPAAGHFDPYQSALHGGYPATPGGQTQQSGWYGQEFDAKFTWDFALPGRVTLQAGAEGGVLVPGETLKGIGNLGNPWLAKGLAALKW